MERYHKKQAHSFKVSSNHPFQILSDLITGDRRQLINPIKKYLQNGKAENLNEKRQKIPANHGGYFFYQFIQNKSNVQKNLHTVKQRKIKIEEVIMEEMQMKTDPFNQSFA